MHDSEATARKKIVELKLTIERLVSATAKRRECGITFIGFQLLILLESVTTDKLLVTDEAVKCLDIRR